MKNMTLFEKLNLKKNTVKNLSASQIGGGGGSGWLSKAVKRAAKSYQYSKVEACTGTMYCGSNYCEYPK